ncbi:MAG: tail fiber domain-containing protein [Candidatus Nanoarchaeia archaeon]|nr:tail fiber domain-containing protein [Candidatus Nanoarchaeia archaeon]
MRKEVLFGILFLILLINLSSAARLPAVSGDSDTWGTVLNEFLNTSLNDTGHLRDNVVSTNQISEGTIVDDDISDATNLTLGQKITFAFGEIIDNIVDGLLSITGNLNVTGDVISNGNNLTNAYLYSTNGTYYLATNPFAFYNSTNPPPSTGSGVPTGAIVAFEGACPTGWVFNHSANGTGIVDSGSNNNSSWIKYSDGTMMQWGNGTAVYVSTSVLVYNWTFPEEFIDTNIKAWSIGNGNPALAVNIRNFSVPYHRTSSLTTTGTQLGYVSASLYSSGDEGGIDIFALGRWTNDPQSSLNYCVKTGEDTPVSNTIWGESGDTIVLQNLSKNVNIQSNVTALRFIGDGSGITGVVASSSIWNVSGTNVFPSSLSYNVGIGTASPGYKLEIQSPDGANIATYLAQIYNLDVTAGQGHGLRIVAGNGASDTPFYVTNRTGSALLYVGGDGNIGIGTASPDTTLQVLGQTELGVDSVINTPQNFLTFQTYGANYAHFYDLATAGTNKLYLGESATLAGIPSSPIMTWDLSNGNVGIGTTSPLTTLEINGSVSAMAEESAFGIRPISYMSVALQTAEDMYIDFDDDNNGSGGLTFRSGNTNVAVLTNAGNLGIGMTPVLGMLDVNSNTVSLPSATVWISRASDSRLKTITSNFTDGMNIINQINPVNYNFNGITPEGNDTKNHIGLLADELPEIAPYMAVPRNYTITKQDMEIINKIGLDAINKNTPYPLSKNIKEGDTITLYGWDATAFNFIFINAFKEQQEEIDDLTRALCSSSISLEFGELCK